MSLFYSRITNLYNYDFIKIISMYMIDLTINSNMNFINVIMKSITFLIFHENAIRILFIKTKSMIVNSSCKL